MSTATEPNIRTDLQRFSPSDVAIAAMRDQYMPLKIAGVEDAEGFKAVHSARMVVREHRVAVEKTRKELKADALEYGRKVDGEAKRLTAMLEPIEDHLTAEESAYNQAKELIRNAAKIKAEAEEKARQEAEAARLKAEHDAEVARLKAESERLAAERAAMEAERQKIESAQAAERQRQRAEQEKIDAANRAIEAEKTRLANLESARLRKIEEERIAAEAAAIAKADTEARFAREAEEKAAAAEAAKLRAEAARLKAESLKPDVEKLAAVGLAVAAIEVPAVSLDAAGFAKRITSVLRDAAETIHQILAEMNPEPF
jgi:hypothetical protein